MSQRMADDDDWYEADYDREDDATVPCPYCQESIPEDVPRCPYCENYLSDEDAPAGSRPVWITIGVLVCLFVVYRWIVH